MAHLSAAKKWPSRNLPRRYPCELDISSGKCPDRSMPDNTSGLDRRELLIGLAATALGQSDPRMASARGRASVALKAKEAVMAPGPGQPEIPIWALQSSPPEQVVL